MSRTHARAHAVSAREPWRRVLLIGFMAAGKTTVGAALAAALGWDFADVDRELVRDSGVSVAEFFRLRGEAAFRREESRLTAELCSRERLVLATGGGWPGSGPGALPPRPPGSAVVWLRVSVAEALRRARLDATLRPLLAGPDPEGTAAALLALREPRYRQADFTVDVDQRSPADVTHDIVAWLKTSIS
jgi:shikimate kinase